MATSHFDQCLLEATVPDETHSPMGSDCLYGLYTSWCLLHRINPAAEITFRAAMQRCGVDRRQRRLRMTGPAAADYILASYPDGE
jgi:hypothetical protein